ncbi:hypothetical protein C8Q77DRAFT_1115305 [Trametes polyzona]|nr:hypothetical protein C8Q77DRAFT_1115305 [Trametes polyzona]
MQVTKEYARAVLFPGSADGNPLVPSANMPALRGDAKGNYRVLVVGNSGVGKSTVGREVAAILDIPFIPLDTLFWGTGWTQCPREEFRAKVRAALDGDPRGWVVDGNYTSHIGTMTYEEATDVIWLDPPLALYFPRLCWRTFLRLLRLAPPCSPGCEERASEVFFSRESIVWWCLTHHWSVRKRYGERYSVDGVHVGGKVRRIGGWGSQLDAWKRDVRAMSATQGEVLPPAAAEIADA